MAAVLDGIIRGGYIDTWKRQQKAQGQGKTIAIHCWRCMKYCLTRAEGYSSQFTFPKYRVDYPNKVAACAAHAGQALDASPDFFGWKKIPEQDWGKYNYLLMFWTLTATQGKDAYYGHSALYEVSTQLTLSNIPIKRSTYRDFMGTLIGAYVPILNYIDEAARQASQSAAMSKLYRNTA